MQLQPVHSFNLLTHPGCSDYLKTVDPRIWAYAMRNEATQPPPFFPNDFYNHCYQLVFISLDGTYTEM